jgi:hypothetical protein
MQRQQRRVATSQATTDESAMTRIYSRCVTFFIFIFYLTNKLLPPSLDTAPPSLDATPPFLDTAPPSDDVKTMSQRRVATPRATTTTNIVFLRCVIIYIFIFYLTNELLPPSLLFARPHTPNHHPMTRKQHRRPRVDTSQRRQLYIIY